jgi:hypothetical protein
MASIWIFFGAENCFVITPHCMEVYQTIFLAADFFLPNSPRSSLHPINTNRINKWMMALADAKSTLSIAIDTVTRPYAYATATTQETVS